MALVNGQQPDLWTLDEPTETDQAGESMDVERTASGASGNNPGRWHRVPYTEKYRPTPGVITGRDVYNAWCFIQQAEAETLRTSGYTTDANTIERAIWRYPVPMNGQKNQFEQVAELLNRMCHPQESDPPMPERFSQRYGHEVETDRGRLFQWRTVKEDVCPR
jgi:hypothetical protein